MNATITIDCPECHGAGSVTIRHYSNDPQLDRDVMCGACCGTGDATTPVNQSDEE